ncbi:MAG: hypothetical protein Q7T30_02775, partial [Planctomycetota bacterium]|nr:hypothetical protein [Planctomycetota bacterium]
ARAAAAPPAERARWLELMAAMPMPEAMPIATLLAWRRDAVSEASATAVLETWSRRFAAQWQPLIARGSVDPERYSHLYHLGPKAFGAVEELRRQLADGSLRTPVGWVFCAILGVDREDPPAPWLTALTHSDDGRRAEAVQVLCTLFAGRNEAAADVVAALARLVADPCPATAEGAAILVLQLAPTALDGQLDALVRSPFAVLRAAAASRYAALGRAAEAEPIWRQLVTDEPMAMYQFESWDLLARHGRTTEARELLLDAMARGQRSAVLQLQRVAGTDPRALDAIVAHAREHGWGIAGTFLGADTQRALCERLAAVLDDPNTPAAQRATVFQNLLAATPDSGRRDVFAQGLRGRDAAVRTFALEYGVRAGVVPDAAAFSALLAEPATRDRAAAVLAGVALPADFDPSPYPVHGCVLATWADGDPQRLALLVDRLLAADAAALEAIHLLQPDLRGSHARFPLPGPGVPAFWHQHAAGLGAVIPDVAAEWRIHRATARPDAELLCPPPRRAGREYAALVPIDDALRAAVRRRLVDPAPAQRAEALQLLAWLGTDGRPLLADLLTAAAGFDAAQLARVPGVVCAIAPDAAVSVCEPLLAHADARVVAAAMCGPVEAQRPLKIPGGAAFALTIAARLASDQPVQQPTAWFAFLEDGIAALPELRDGLRRHPDRTTIAAALRDLGPAAAAALPELVAALPVNPFAAPALRAVASPQQRLEHLLPLLGTDLAAIVGPLLQDVPIDGAALATIERLAGDERAAVRAAVLPLLAVSASELAAADAVRREWLAAGRGAQVDARHWQRLWPQLTAAERTTLFAALAYRTSGPLLPDGLAQAIAVSLDADPDATAFRALLHGAPLHPRVLEHLTAAAEFWNPPPGTEPYALPAQHAFALVQAWEHADAAFRGAALPWLRRHATASVESANQRRYIVSTAGEPTPWPPFFELLEQLAVPAGFYAALPWLRDSDVMVRRAALRVMVATVGLPPRALEQAVHACLLDRTWPEQFGPLDGLPPSCAALAASFPPVAERVAALRRSHADAEDRAVSAIVADLAAARALLPELRQVLHGHDADRQKTVLACLRRLGPDAAELLPDVELLLRIPVLHFEAVTTARILRGELPPQPPRVGTGSGPSGPWPTAGHR